jgi:hypothetical protein
VSDLVQELTECAEKRSHDKEDDGNGGRRHECRPLLAYGRCKLLIYILAMETTGSMIKSGCFPDVCLRAVWRA